MKYKYFPLPGDAGKLQELGRAGVQLSLGKEGLCTESPCSLPTGSAAQSKPGLGEKAASSWASGASPQPLGIHKKEQQPGRFFWDST